MHGPGGGGTRAPRPVQAGTERSRERGSRPAEVRTEGRGRPVSSRACGVIAAGRGGGREAAVWRPWRGAAAAAMPGQKSFRRRREDDDEEEEEEDRQLAEEVRWVGRRRGAWPGPVGSPTAPGAAAVGSGDGMGPRIALVQQCSVRASRHRVVSYRRVRLCCER